MQKEDSNVSARVASIIASKKRRLSGKRRILASCEPEFLVSTPEKLLELVSLKAMDLSGFSFLVVGGVESLYKGGCLDALKSIRQSISVCPRAVVFNNFLYQSACVVQTTNVCTSDEIRLIKGIQVLNHACDSQLASQPLKPGYECQKETSGLRDQCGAHPTTDLAFYETVIFPNFVQSIDNYVQTLTRMARHTINGVSHSFLTTEDAPIAGPRIKILEQCGQAVPDALRNLHLTSSMLES
uniref:Uncharacterized protein n=1 Tax=Populus trichocarpa TaxID=3694 RepID=A0A2K1ZAM0_POPTR